MKTYYIKLLKAHHYSANWVFQYPPIPEGTIVPAIEATNLPRKKEGKRFWVDTPELQNDPYGIVVEPGDYELIPEREG